MPLSAAALALLLSSTCCLAQPSLAQRRPPAAASASLTARAGPADEAAGQSGPADAPGAQASSTQVGAIELQVGQLLAEARRQQLDLQQLHQRLREAESANRWLPILLLALVGSGALALWLGLRVRRLQQSATRHAGDAAATQAAALWRAAPEPAERGPAGAPLFTPQAGDGASGRSAAAANVPLAPVPPPRTPAGSAPPAGFGAPGVAVYASGVPPRPVSVEELLDLEQQADFFLVLGQEQAAIDLLLGHVRATGGASALPYFKLLQIYRGQGDADAYERTRDRFNQRFNAQVPDWQGDLAAGRDLTDYPELVLALQQAWPQPPRALALLESMLLRRADLEPLDLPAFHDILTLHALVGDLPDQAAADSAPGVTPAAAATRDVDILLPFGDAVPAGPQAAGAQALLADWVFSRTAVGLAVSGAASQPLDLDLSEPGPAPREFTRPAAFTDIDLRRDSRHSDLAGFDDSDLLPPSITRR